MHVKARILTKSKTVLRENCSKSDVNNNRSSHSVITHVDIYATQHKNSNVARDTRFTRARAREMTLRDNGQDM